MKYVVILGDGMSDYPVDQLGGKTPLQCAVKPNIDFLAKYGEVGMVKTVPEGIPPGSDAANLSVMGYDPRKYYSGRSPLEAVSMGVELLDTDIAMRCNLVTLSDEESYEEKTMLDYSSDEISSEEAAILINEVNNYFKTENISFYAGISYRHCMVWHNGLSGFKLIPPHDILERRISNYLPSAGEDSNINAVEQTRIHHVSLIKEMMTKSYSFLKDHPVNKARIAKGLRPANSIWLWGEGKKPAIPSFTEKYSISGAVVSAVDLIKGIGMCAGLTSIDVEGATGNIHTNFTGKAAAAIKALEDGADFVYVHVEAPDECGHRYEIDNKVRSISLLDEKVAGPILEGLRQFGEYSVMVLPDHPTPLTLRTHTSEPVPYIIYRSNDRKESGVKGYDEFQAKETGIYVHDGYTLMDRFIGK